MNRSDHLERLLKAVDEASQLVRELPENDRLCIHLRELEGTSNGSHYYGDHEADYYLLRDHVALAILKEKGELPSDCDPQSI